MAKKKNTGAHNDAMFRDVFKEGFKRQYQNGLLQGARAMCKVVYDKACDEHHTLEERIEDIKSFVGTLLSIPVKEEPGDAKEEPVEQADTPAE